MPTGAEAGAAGNQTAVIDALGKTTTRLFNSKNRLSNSVSPEGRATLFTYDAAGNVTRITRSKIPEANVRNADFIESAVVPRGTAFITREAPGVGANVGGGIEVVVESGSVKMRSFSQMGP